MGLYNLGVRRPAITTSMDLLFNTHSDYFFFYFIGEWSDRKVPWLLIEAFNKEFRPHEKVALILKTGVRDWTRTRRSVRSFFRKSVSLSADAFRRSNKSRNKKIIHITKVLSGEEIMTLHNRSQCFISLTRGEGWGMPSYEAAWYGKPVIITGSGGMLDYLSIENAYLINLDYYQLK